MTTSMSEFKEPPSYQPMTMSTPGKMLLLILCSALLMIEITSQYIAMCNSVVFVYKHIVKITKL